MIAMPIDLVRVLIALLIFSDLLGVFLGAPASWQFFRWESGKLDLEFDERKNSITVMHNAMFFWVHGQGSQRAIVPLAYLYSPFP